MAHLDANDRVQLVRKATDLARIESRVSKRPRGYNAGSGFRCRPFRLKVFIIGLSEDFNALR